MQEISNLNKNTITYIFHLLVVGPLLMYVGYKGRTVESHFFTIILVMAIIAMAYHGNQLFERLCDKKSSE